MKRLLAVVGAAVAAWAVGSGCATEPPRDPPFDEESPLEPGEEFAFGRSIAARLSTGVEFVEDAKARAYVARVGGVVAAASRRPDPYDGYRFYIVQDPRVSTFSAPGGFVFVTTGALKALKDEDLGLYLLNMGKPKGGLLIAMHGGGENAGDAGSAQSIWAGATAQGMTVIAPQAIDLVSSAWNQEKQERFVLDLIDAARRTLDVDPDRVCLAGHSMGGDGSWMLGGRNADRLAAAAPLAGSVMPYMKQGAVNRLQTPLSSYEGLQEGVIANLMHLPLWIHHSADDPNEAIHPDDIATGRLRTLQERFPGRYEFRYDRVDGNGHALPKGGVKPILQWMAGRTRRAHPDEVVWETWNPWKERMYWLFSRGHRDSWRFHAKIVAPNAVEVTGTTKPLAGRTAPAEMALTLLLGPELFDLSKPLKVTSGGKVLFEGRVEPSFFALMASILPRNDPKQWYRAHVDLKVPRLPWKELWD
ncbi:MAG: hypothetical protein HUU15_05945 [Candidatus Brocadiae bacterium]|nr:hypothetical protein [Candidatus Brocadiia bacterium]